jgi:TolB-like protein/class 3 adenylate cyclase/Tfp pilus assembly protein PilF
MAKEEKTVARLEIAYVLFMDIVGYSKLLMDEQSEALHELNRIVHSTAAVQDAEQAGKLVRLPTGDGMALVFTSSVEAPVECALEVSQALRAQPSLPLRMGVHSGPVQYIEDVNGRENVTGAGINIAQRVMDCGDAGHILVSKRVADDLATARRWQPYLHDLGDFEVKHGLVISLFNLYAEVLGNPTAPLKFTGEKSGKKPAPASAWKKSGFWLFIAAALLIGTALALGIERWVAGGPPAILATVQLAAPPNLARAPDKSIAVLPFENLSDDKENAFFTDGVQDEILTDLAKVADLKVIASSSVMQYKSGAARNLPVIAAQLGVANILEGSVQRAGHQVRVTAQLVKAHDAAQLWAGHYDRPLDDVFAIQSEIAEAIVAQLRARLSPEEKSAINERPTADLQAFDLYLRAQILFQANGSDLILARAKMPEARRLLDAAVARDPKFLLAWCLLSRVHCILYFWDIDHTPERLEQATAAVQAAVRLQPDTGETHLALADYYYHGFRDYTRARAELELARRALPNNAEVFEYASYIDRREGRWTESIHNLKQALELDPRNFFLLQQEAITDSWMHCYDDEARAYDRALAIVPGDPITRIYRASVPLDAQADAKPYHDAVVALLAANPKLAPDIEMPEYALCERTPAAAARMLTSLPPDTAGEDTYYSHAFWEGVVARWEGDAPRARAAFTVARRPAEKAALADPNSGDAIGSLGMIDAALGRKEEAISEGRRACELQPVSKDAQEGAATMATLAQILAWSGEKNAAIDEIATIERAPNELSYGALKLNPMWDDLRGDPRFEKIVASLAPKQNP